LIQIKVICGRRAQVIARGIFQRAAHLEGPVPAWVDILAPIRAVGAPGVYVPQDLANQDLYHALLDLRRGLHLLLDQLDSHKNLAGAGEVARHMDDHLGEIIPAVRMPRVALGRKRPLG
jgi:hypothetical protein